MKDAIAWPFRLLVTLFILMVASVLAATDYFRSH